MIKWLIITLVFNMNILSASRPFFKSNVFLPYHISVGAVLFNDQGSIACHHFIDKFGEKDLYILMRESMENGETPMDTLHRGLMEEFGATAEPLGFLGALSGDVPGEGVTFEKTTLYIACRLKKFDPSLREADDPEGDSTIEWLSYDALIAIMKAQGKKFGRIDLDESRILERAKEHFPNGAHSF